MESLEELKQAIQKERDMNTQMLRAKTPKSDRRKSVLFGRIEMLNWVLGELDGLVKNHAKTGYQIWSALELAEAKDNEVLVDRISKRQWIPVVGGEDTLK